jgi:hypothetical protein
MHNEGWNWNLEQGSEYGSVKLCADGKQVHLSRLKLNIGLEEPVLLPEVESYLP